MIPFLIIIGIVILFMAYVVQWVEFFVTEKFESKFQMLMLAICPLYLFCSTIYRKILRNKNTPWF